MALSVCLVVCNEEPADHFATFAQHLRGVEMCASEPALTRFRKLDVNVNIPFFTEGMSPAAEEVLATQIAKIYANAAVVMTDMGHPFDLTVQRAFAKHAPSVRRLVYYDDPEPYSATGAQVMQAAQGILFANSRLAKSPLFQAPNIEIDLGERKRVGIGYSPTTHMAKNILQRRRIEQRSMRRLLLTRYRTIDVGQKIVVYFGSHHEEYFLKALPTFLALLAKGGLPPVMVLIQPLPDAQNQHRNREIIEAWTRKHPTPQVVLSNIPAENAQVVADAVLYYKTRMAPQFVLAGIPTMHMGHEPCKDMLVNTGLIPSITTVEQFIGAMNPDSTSWPEKVCNSLGINPDWLQILSSAILPLLAVSLLCAEENFLLIDGESCETVLELGSDIDERVTPCSTFKIALSLMGFDAGILEDETTPLWLFQEGYEEFLPSWKHPQTPQSWMSNSCVWYSQLLAERLGSETFEQYLAALDYGNQDATGGLTHAWLNSSLTISPREQIHFIHHLIHGTLPLSEHAMQMTKNLLFVEEWPLSWKLFGKTGSCSDRGWFVGWIENEEHFFPFAYQGPLGRSERILRVKQLLSEVVL